MANSRLLVTGGAGFIGSNFINKALKKNKQWEIINLDKLTYAGNLLNLKSVEASPRYKFIKGDISSKKLVDKIFCEYKFDVVINFAAESHVDRSILKPDQFLKTNIVGTQVLLEAAKRFDVPKFIQISTDEVYGSVHRGKSKENDRLQPNSPYSSSKASADLLCRAYYKTYGVPVIITRSSNNYGPYQFLEKLIPLIINNAINGKPLPIYADGKNMRDWIYVDDNCEAIIKVVKKGEIGAMYNIGGGSTEKNINIVKKICEIVSTKTGQQLSYLLSLITYVKDRPAHDFRYCLDSNKIKKDLGWKPNINLDKGLEQTVGWYLSNPVWVKSVISRKYKKYYKANYLDKY